MKTLRRLTTAVVAVCLVAGLTAQPALAVESSVADRVVDAVELPDAQATGAENEVCRTIWAHFWLTVCVWILEETPHGPMPFNVRVCFDRLCRDVPGSGDRRSIDSAIGELLRTTG